MATKLPRLVEPKKKLSRPKPPLIPANTVIDLDAVMMGANKQKAPKFHRNFMNALSSKTFSLFQLLKSSPFRSCNF